MTRTVSRARVPDLDGTDAVVWVAIIAIETTLVAGYLLVTDTTIETGRYLVYPFVWINAGLWAVWHTRPAAGSRRHRLLGVLVASGYALLLLTVSGKVGFGAAGTALAPRVAWYVPGWGPIVSLESEWLRLYLVPFEVIGYASLAYLMYANTLAVARGTLSGALGLVTCIGCTVPVLAPLTGLLGGPTTALVTTAYRWSYDLGTVVFLVTVGLLYAGQRDRSDR